jgi:hypothetical protein
MQGSQVFADYLEFGDRRKRTTSIEGDRLIDREHRSQALVRSNGDENRPPDSGETNPPRDGP